MVALRDGKADFVELLIENGFVLESFMDNNRLEQLFALDMVSSADVSYWFNKFTYIIKYFILLIH